MGPYDRDVAYLRELAERLHSTTDEDPDYLRIRFNDLYTALDRFMRLVASEDPNIPPQVQMEAADKTATDSLRVYEILAVYAAHFIGPDEVRRLKYLSGIRSRVLHQGEDVTPQAIEELLDLTDVLGMNAEGLGVTVSGPAQRSYSPGLAAAMNPEDGDPDDAPVLGYSQPTPQQRTLPRTLPNSPIGGVSPVILIGAAGVLVLVVVALIFFITRPQTPTTPGGLATQTPLPAGQTPIVAVDATPTTAVVVSSDTPVIEVPPTETTAPVVEPPPAQERWVTNDILNLRDAASTGGNVIRELPAGAIVTSHPDGQVVNADGYDWRHVVDDEGNEGWVASDFLTPEG